MSSQQAQFAAVLCVRGDEGQRIRALRKAGKLLLRACGVRIVELRPIEKLEARNVNVG